MRARPGTGEQYGSRILQLRPAHTGDDVWELQIKMLGWGSGTDRDQIGSLMDPVKVTGTFDTTTRDAVMRFQEAHGLAINGIVNAPVFRAIDQEAAFHPIFVHNMKCPCVRGDNNAGPILCKCGSHPNPGVCTGFGNARFNLAEGRDDRYLLNDKFLADGTTALSPEHLDVYDMKEHAGIDKALLWAVRGLMHRANVSRLGIVSGYRCWQDNYHHTDDIRWHHRRSTFHFGKAIEFYHEGACGAIGPDPAAPAVTKCNRCEAIRRIAEAKCGFQLRWQEPDRVSVTENDEDAPLPTTPFAVHVDTVRLLSREDIGFVTTHTNGLSPYYGQTDANTHAPVSFPYDLGSGLDPRVAPSAVFFQNVERRPAGRFPMGGSRIWHGGIHIYSGGARGNIHSIWDGEIVGCRVDENATEKTYGSRNFVVIKHTWRTNVFYSLSMHLDAYEAAAQLPWRRQLQIRTVKHVEAIVPIPFLIRDADRFSPMPGSGHGNHEGSGLGAGDRMATAGAGAEIDPRLTDDRHPENTRVVQLQTDAGDIYVYTRLEGVDVARIHNADGNLQTKITRHDVIGLSDPIRVFAGDVLGRIADPPTNAELTSDGSFVHIETFAESAFVTGAGYTNIDATNDAEVADRQAITNALITAGVLVEPRDRVLLDADIRRPGTNPHARDLRSVILNTPSAWKLDWVAALAGPQSLGFMSEADRNTLAAQFSEYQWWTEVADGSGDLPGSEAVHHYHPIALLLHIAYAPPP